MSRHRLPSRKDLGSVLAAFRTRAGLTQEKLGHAAGLHPVYVSGVERGARNASFEAIGKLLAAMSVSWAEFGREIDAKTGSSR